MEVKDILVDEDFDLIIKDGDFVVGESTQQHQRFLLLLNKGESKQSPTIGVGLRNFILDDGDGDELESIITSEFENDGMKITKLNAVSTEQFEVIANYRDEQEDNSIR